MDSGTKVGGVTHYGATNKSSAMSRLEKYIKKPERGEGMADENGKPLANINVPAARLKPQYNDGSRNPGRPPLKNEMWLPRNTVDKNNNSSNAVNYSERNERSVKLGGTARDGPVSKPNALNQLGRNAKPSEKAEAILPDGVKSKSCTNLDALANLRLSYSKASSGTALQHSLNKCESIRTHSASPHTVDTNNNSTNASNKPRKHRNNMTTSNRGGDTGNCETSPTKAETLKEKVNKCICHRPKTHILCTICGYTTFGYIRTPCYAHLRLTYLLDMVCCPRCNSSHLMEVASRS